MSVDVGAAEGFITATARLLDRHRAAVLVHGASPELVIQALRAYRNADGGFGHALEPDVRAPDSEPASTLHALEILTEIQEPTDPMVAEAAAWIGSIADAQGAVPFVLPASAAHPHAPWMVSSGEPSFLTFALAARLFELGSRDPWMRSATLWCWSQAAAAGELGAYWIKFALDFLDHVPDESRAEQEIERLRLFLGPDGSLPVPGGTENERLRPLALSPRPGLRSRALFSDDQIEADLDRIEQGQQEDGGWTFDWLAWSPGQTVEWRGMLTVSSLATLAAHGRIRLPARK